MGGGNEIHLYTENDGKLQLPVNMEQVDIDVEYWSRYGKTDQIILNPNRKTILQAWAQLYRNTAMTAIRMKARCSEPLQSLLR